MGALSGGESEGNDVRSVVALEEAEFRFWALMRSVLAFWLLLDAEEAWEEDRRWI